MIVFQVDDMSCAHCSAAITQAVKAVDADAQLRIDLDAHRVEIDSRTANAGQFDAAIREAGYTPKPA
ncbi:heavy-metal-associated domain-containing protein [Aquincola sp. S2]|uniref:Heavy-metal-associated domain-containing protein n=1 Tax=Pseudaquabacterium terrae TaxID=2732868 RepID=A0ABX2E9F6_9BURK|nr:heavy-metal-associated domain-containing protein [Aquabacterium terrae]NRF65630.1 heavy-metal-associated domain-containing protein [Aquabacterium terrae]